MYESCLKASCDPWFPVDAVPWHVGSRHDVVTRAKLAVSRAGREGKQAVKEICPRLVNWIADASILRAAWDCLAAKGETAPGPNGRRYEDLDDAETWELLRSIGAAIREGTYKVGRERHVQIPKDRANPSRGYRTLTLLNIKDRVVQRAAVEILQPLLDPMFGRNVLGYRPGRGRLHALALAEREALAGNRFVFLAEDIKDAFDQVPLNRLLDVLVKHVPSPDLRNLVNTLLATGKTHGIRQGGPLSPLLLNLYLHHFLDEPWRREHAETPLIRVADDLLALCRSRKEAAQARAKLEALLKPAGMPLKGTRDGSIHDLRKGEVVDWLGFEIGKGEQGLETRIANKAWSRLAEYLHLAHEKPNAPLRAVATINGWIEQMGPCYPFVTRGTVYRRVAKLAAEQAFDEIPSRDAIMARWKRAYERWQDIQDEIRKRPEALDSRWAPPATATTQKSAAAAGAELLWE